ncbi:hypothetical protein ACFFKU_07745 [Kineococcus gynurae]|uniref:DUF4190 domain-containing protein n=1 Tax=Kineococcus gynurae TaxID=452979 RepID=A0ABV5LWJ3_9ACTN
MAGRPERTEERGIGALICLLVAVVSLLFGLIFVPAAIALALAALVVAGPPALRGGGPDRGFHVAASVVAIVSLVLSVLFLVVLR